MCGLPALRFSRSGPNSRRGCWATSRTWRRTRAGPRLAAGAPLAARAERRVVAGRMGARALGPAEGVGYPHRRFVVDVRIARLEVLAQRAEQQARVLAHVEDVAAHVGRLDLLQV